MFNFLLHLLFDGIADAGGYWASKYCPHPQHRIAIAVGFCIVTTFLLVEVVG